MTTLSSVTLTVAEGDFNTAVLDRSLSIGIVGLGYTGLPLALGFASAGFTVTGMDTNAERVAAVNTGQSYLPDLTDLALLDAADRLAAHVDANALSGVNVVIICVPTPAGADRSADLSYVETAVGSLLPHLRRGMLVVLQSTVPAGTTSRIARTIAERTGLIIGRDVYLAMAPERVDPANTSGWTLQNTPKVVGGVGPESVRRGKLLFEQICATVVDVPSSEVAELAKLFENTFRLVNIALMIELSELCRTLQVPVRAVIDAAATKPFGFMPHYPGPGVGGECIPVDPLFLIERGRSEGVVLELVETAHRHVVNRPFRVVSRVAELLAERGIPLSGARVLLVGVSYKAGVPDLRNAPALDIVRGLRRAGAVISYYDPMVPGLEVDGVPVTAQSWGPGQLAEPDCVVLVTPHGRLVTEPAWDAASLILDTCGVLRRTADNVVTL